MDMGVPAPEQPWSSAGRTVRGHPWATHLEYPQDPPGDFGPDPELPFVLVTMTAPSGSSGLIGGIAVLAPGAHPAPLLPAVLMRFEAAAGLARPRLIGPGLVRLVLRDLAQPSPEGASEDADTRQELRSRLFAALPSDPSCPRVGGVFRLRPVAEPRWWPDSPAQRAAAAELDARLAAEQARAALIANVAARQAALVHTRPTHGRGDHDGPGDSRDRDRDAARRLTLASRCASAEDRGGLLGLGNTGDGGGWTGDDGRVWNDGEARRRLVAGAPQPTPAHRALPRL